MQNDTEVLVNQTKTHISLHLYSIVPIICIIVGVPGNLISAFIWIRRINTTLGSTSLLLVVLCLTDTYVLIHGCIRQWLIGVTREKVDIRVLSGCHLALILFTTATDYSAWIIVLLCAERAVCAWRPFEFKFICNIKRGRLALLVVASVLLVINGHFFWTSYRHGNTCQPNDSAFVRLWPYIDSAVYSFIPFICIVFLNCSIIWKLECYKPTASSSSEGSGPSKRRSVPLTFSGKSARNREQRSGRLLRTVFCMAFSHLLLTTPIVVYFFLDDICSNVEQQGPLGNLPCDVTETVATLLQMINHMTHFFIYSFTSSSFLSDLKQMCRTSVTSQPGLSLAQPGCSIGDSAVQPFS